jgi:hypothetical protein
MEDLIRLVAESFARCGINDPSAAVPQPAYSSSSADLLPQALPEHNFRHSSNDPAP